MWLERDRLMAQRWLVHVIPGLRALGNRPGWDPTRGYAAPRLPLAAFSSVTQPTEAASLLGQLKRLPGTAAR